MSPLQLDPEFAKAAAPFIAMAATVPVPKIHDVETRRANHNNRMVALADSVPTYPNVSKTTHKIKSHDGAEIAVFQYSLAPSSQPTPALIHVHGGGMICGDALSFASLAQGITSASGLQTFDVDYRLAPEHRHPSLVEDVYAALLWLHANAAQLNVDPARIGIMGESAGGGIAAGVTLLARDRKLSPPLAKQILIYPMLDYQTRSIEPQGIEKYLVWTAESNITGWTALLGDQIEGEVSPYASAAHAKDLSGLPSTFIDVGTLDLFRDEDVEYASRLIKANIDTELHVYPGVPHAFELFAPDIAITKQAMANRLRALKSF